MKEENRADMDKSFTDGVVIEAYAARPSGLKSLRRRQPAAPPEQHKRKAWSWVLSFFLLPVHLVVFTAIGVVSGAVAWHSDTFGEGR